MDPATNVPYKKKFNKNGICINAIEHDYISYDENRRSRRAYKNEPRFKGNSPGPHLTVLKDSKYVRVVQWIKCKITDKKGKVVKHWLKPIKHYLPSQVNSVKAVNQEAVKP
jgi:hypothetical protein